MELRDIETILTIEEEGSISKAAAKLYMAQSSISQFLTNYENELDVKLFMRTSGGVRLTKSGEIFVRNARQILQQYHQMKGELTEIKELNSGKIDLGISSFRGSYLLPKVLVRFKQLYPGIDVIIHEHDSIKLREMMINGTLDIALLAIQPYESMGMTVDSVMHEEVLLVINKNHPAAQYLHYDKNTNHPWVDFKDINSYEFMLSNKTTILGNAAEQLFANTNTQPKATNHNLTAAFAASLARAGLGIAFTYNACSVEKPDVVYARIGESGYFVNLVLVTPANGYRTRATRALESLIHEVLSKEKV